MIIVTEKPIVKGSIIRHRNGTEGMVTGQWFNQGGQKVWNIRECDTNRMASWNALSIVGGAS